MGSWISSPTRWYRHTVYILHPVETRFPRFTTSEICCVHDNAVTQCWFWRMSWREDEPTDLIYCWNSMKLLCEDVPYRVLSVTVGEATRDLEDAHAAGKEISLNKALLDRVHGADGTRPGERWDLYTVDVKSCWPKTLYNPEPDHNLPDCVVM